MKWFPKVSSLIQVPYQVTSMLPSVKLFCCYQVFIFIYLYRAFGEQNRTFSVVFKKRYGDKFFIATLQSISPIITPHHRSIAAFKIQRQTIAYLLMPLRVKLSWNETWSYHNNGMWSRRITKMIAALQEITKTLLKLSATWVIVNVITGIGLAPAIIINIAIVASSCLVVLGINCTMLCSLSGW